MTTRRWATVLNAALTGGHSAYELAAGVAMPAQDLVGLTGACTLHAGALSWWAAAGLEDQRSRPMVAVLDGMALGAVVTHFVAWPRRRRVGLPVLAPGAEGLRAGWVAWYNPLLYVWGAAALLAVASHEAASRRRALAVAACTVPVVTVASHAKCRWARAQAELRPRWWNRSFRPT